MKIKGRLIDSHYETAGGGYLFCADFVNQQLRRLTLPDAIQVTASTRPFKGGHRSVLRIYYTLHDTPLVFDEQGRETSTWLARMIVKFLKVKPINNSDRGRDRVIYFHLEAIR